MTDFVTLPPRIRLEMESGDAVYPVRRVFCIGRNYADHAKEMGAPAEALFFMKPAEAMVKASSMAFPKATENLHHEVELVVALGEGGRPVASAVGIDLTRRDQQSRMKEKRAPWEISKAFEGSAPVGILRAGPPPASGRIALSVNGEVRQEADLSDMLIDIQGILDRLGAYFEPGPGDLIFTGTPAGVGQIKPGDRVDAQIVDLPPLSFAFDPEI